MSAKELLAAAKAASERDQWTEAESYVLRAIALEETNASHYLVLGIVRFNKADFSGAREAFQDALKLEPKNFVAFNWLGRLCQESGEFVESLYFCKQAVELAPLDPEAHLNAGVSLTKLDRLEEAVVELKRAVKLRPRWPAALYALASVLTTLDRIPEAIEFLNKAISLAPSEQGFVDLVEAQIRVGQAQIALHTGELAEKNFPNSAPIQIMLARVFEELENHTQFETRLESALLRNPNLPEYFILKGKRLQQLGSFAEAEDVFKRVTQLQPLLGHPYLNIASGRKLTKDDAEIIGRMEEALNHPGLHPSQVPPLLYALAKASDNLGEFKRAIHFYDRANAAQKSLKLRSRPFQLDQVEDQVSKRIQHYRESIYHKLRAKANHSHLPIIVAGMMRSGTTLVEQIVSSHPLVGGAGEVSFWSSREKWYFDFSRESFDEPALIKAGSEYVDLLKNKRPSFEWVTDKNPSNIMALGMIHAALPNAKLIHTVREPVDNALSIWMTPVEIPPSFCCDRNNIVSMYRQYQNLSKFWRSSLPADRYLEIRYEELTNHPEQVIPKLIQFLDLPWNEACLHPELNSRSVSTPSLWQVRQPLYKSSVAKWKNYEPWIPEFMELAS